MPGTKDYDPSLPWLSKMRSDNIIACDFFIYVDDVRITGPTEESVWEAIRKISSLFGYLGIQDAPRKRRAPSTCPGAWAGSMVYLKDGFVGVFVDQKKWDKTQEHLLWLKQEINKCQGPAVIDPNIQTDIHHKELERRRGFLVYVSRTYPSMVPYLKGIHQTLDGWREGRDNDGWRISMAELKAAKDLNDEM